jgi:hypothetical protein
MKRHTREAVNAVLIALGILSAAFGEAILFGRSRM